MVSIRAGRSIAALLTVVATLSATGASAAAVAASRPLLETAVESLSDNGFRSPVPLPLTVVTPFFAPERRFGPGHRGVDLAVPAGSPVRAAGSGTVVFAGSVAGRSVVSIEHEGGLRTTYEPLTPAVAAGARVTAGDVIGTLDAGHAGCPGLDCLHWGARLPDRVYLDPLLLLGTWPVRLWPWTDP
jgi:murein DD-endopeptidase MepM/ murein hydrolase activator NlpD